MQNSMDKFLLNLIFLNSFVNFQFCYKFLQLKNVLQPTFELFKCASIKPYAKYLAPLNQHPTMDGNLVVDWIYVHTMFLLKSLICFTTSFKKMKFFSNARSIIKYTYNVFSFSPSPPSPPPRTCTKKFLPSYGMRPNLSNNHKFPNFHGLNVFVLGTMPKIPT
jgi:hypothetical protein